MSEPHQKQSRPVVSSSVSSLFEMLFFGLALIAFAIALGTVACEIWGFFVGRGWYHYALGDALDWLLGMPPLVENMTVFHKGLAVMAILPLDISMAVLGWLFSKISNGFEKLT